MMFIPHKEDQPRKQTKAEQEAMYKLLQEMGFDLDPPENKTTKSSEIKDDKG